MCFLFFFSPSSSLHEPEEIRFDGIYFYYAFNIHGEWHRRHVETHIHRQPKNAIEDGFSMQIIRLNLSFIGSKLI